MRTIAITLAAAVTVLAAGATTAASKGLGGAGGNAVLTGGVFAAPDGGLNGTNQAAPVSGGYSALTAAECKGLGGKVVASTACGLNGGTDACVTVDSDGVVRKMCLSK